MIWIRSNRTDRYARRVADRHYNRQHIGARNFVPPGRCLVLRTEEYGAPWVTSWPFAEFTKHAWAGAWVNSLFRNERQDLYPKSSELILDAVAATMAFYGTPPSLGMITFVNPECVPPTMVRGKPIYGWIYHKAGFKHVGFTEGGLWAWQLLPEKMPIAVPCKSINLEFCL